MKTQLTKDIEQALLRACFASNNKSLAKSYGAFEVTIGFPNCRLTPHTIEVVDFISYERLADCFRCYEIKVSASDLKSKCAKSFYGHYNYLVVPVSLVQEMGDEIYEYIPDYAGIMVYEDGILKSFKKAKKQTLTDETKEVLTVSLMRSLFYKAYKGDV